MKIVERRSQAHAKQNLARIFWRNVPLGCSRIIGKVLRADQGISQSKVVVPPLVVEQPALLFLGVPLPNSATYVKVESFGTYQVERLEVWQPLKEGPTRPITLLGRIEPQALRLLDQRQH